MSSSEDSVSFHAHSIHMEEPSGTNSALVPSSNSLTSSLPAKVSVSMVVNTTSSTSTVTTTMTPPANPNNKKHNLGYRLRRLLFPQLRSSSTATLSKHKPSKDVESGENQNFLRFNTSFYSTSSGDGESHRSSSKRRRTRNQSQQTDIVPEFPILSQQSSTNQSVFNQPYVECSICLLEQSISQFPELSTCHHRACMNCMCQYLRIEIFESRVNITCPQCSEPLHPNDIKSILINDIGLIEKYETFMLRRILITDPDARWCPAPDCDYCVIASGCASCPKLKCERPGCETLFCYHCKQEWHPSQTCDQARSQRGTNRSHLLGSSKSGVTFSGNGTDLVTQANASTSIDPSFLQRDDIKPCPCCKVLIIKMDDGSCNHMTCSVCGTEFCWLCMQKISDLHYLSPSGCTFWGKKPWSRKKKIMWQLGMLVGAPVGIALIAGIAVPAIIIGIPVWVGRKLYARFERNHLSRHKSNLLVTTGVLTSIFVSPILAAVAVGIGVPILLAYVYGVVPFSLCRSGGCGVTTSTSGVRIELDEDEISTNVAPDGVSVDTALSVNRGITNPSIGEVSLGLSTSLSIGSSSHLDRVVLDIQPDRESSSIAACAGSITSNLLNNGTTATSSTGYGKLDSHVDINSNKRYSFSSQNADTNSVTFSLGDRSINTNDDTSLKVHAGSIHDSQAAANFSLSPVEVHVNVSNQNEANNNNNNAPSDKSNSKLLNSASTKSTIIGKNPMVHFDISPQPASSLSYVLNRYESRSLEYLANNYCNICLKSHKPCCPNFQHPNSAVKKSKKYAQAECTYKADDINLETKSNAVTVFERSSNFDANNFNKDFSDVNGDSSNKRLTSNSSSKSCQFINRSNLSKKSISQIFYPSSHHNSLTSDSTEMRTKFPKSGLSHSHSFTITNKNKINNIVNISQFNNSKQ